MKKLSNYQNKINTLPAYCILLLLFSCSSYSTMESQGNIPVNDYLLKINDFPGNWEINYDPHGIRCDSFNMDNCIEGVSVGFENGGNFDQVVFRFHNELFAHTNYANNKYYYIGNLPNGEYWAELTKTFVKKDNPFEEVGVVCEKGNQKLEITACKIRIRIEEYVIYIIYRVVDKSKAESDMVIIINALINRITEINKQID